MAGVLSDLPEEELDEIWNRLVLIQMVATATLPALTLSYDPNCTGVSGLTTDLHAGRIEPKPKRPPRQ